MDQVISGHIVILQQYNAVESRVACGEVGQINILNATQCQQAGAALPVSDWLLSNGLP